jgi:hypothetical protein
MTEQAGVKGPRIVRAEFNGLDVAPRIRAGARAEQRAGTPQSWIHDQAPRLRAAARERRRRETVWAWLSVLMLIVSWDAATRLDGGVLPPRAEASGITDLQPPPFAGAVPPAEGTSDLLPTGPYAGVDQSCIHRQLPSCRGQ